MMRISRKILYLALTVGLSLGAVPALHATPIVYDLTVDHCGGGCGPAGTTFGTVTLNQSGSNTDITVHLNSPYVFAKTGAADFQAFKFNGTGISLADVIIDAHTPALAANTGSFSGDGTGPFAYGIGCPGCGNGLSSSFNTDIVFHVANATVLELTGANSDGFVFVADVGNPATGNTGPVAAVPHADVPEPATIGLLGLGILAIGMVARKKTSARDS